MNSLKACCSLHAFYRHSVSEQQYRAWAACSLTKAIMAYNLMNLGFNRLYIILARAVFLAMTARDTYRRDIAPDTDGARRTLAHARRKEVRLA